MKQHDLKPSQKALAAIPFERAVKNPDFKVLEDLTMKVVYDYGDFEKSMQFHDADGYQALRMRDLHILREVRRALPNLHDPTLSLTAMGSIISHMNTLEGQHAIIRLAENNFPSCKTLNDIRDIVDNNERLHGIPWILKFKIVAPIEEAEFSEHAEIPESRPLPPVSPEAVSKFRASLEAMYPH